MRVTISLMVINVLVFLAGEFIFDNRSFMMYFGLNYLAFNGFWWQIFTTMFLHASLMHLVMNMAVLYQFGFILERALGSLRFGLVYLIGGLITSLLSLGCAYLTTISSGVVVNLVGASGAISVLLGLLASLSPHLRKGLIAAIILISFVPLLIGIKVGWYAHLFGFGVGYLYAKISFKRS